MKEPTEDDTFNKLKFGFTIYEMMDIIGRLSEAVFSIPSGIDFTPQQDAFIVECYNRWKKSNE